MLREFHFVQFRSISFLSNSLIIEICFSCCSFLDNITGHLEEPTVTSRKKKTSAIKLMESTEPLTFLRSQRGRPILVYNNYRHRKERELSGNKEYWRCMLDKCKGRLVICNGYIVKYKQHTHSPPPFSCDHPTNSRSLTLLTQE